MYLLLTYTEHFHFIFLVRQWLEVCYGLSRNILNFVIISLLFLVSDKGYSTTIGPVSISIVKDDLTTFTSGAIVNSTMDDLNLNSGAISRAILAAAGSTIQNEGTNCD